MCCSLVGRGGKKGVDGQKAFVVAAAWEHHGEQNLGNWPHPDRARTPVDGYGGCRGALMNLLSSLENLGYEHTAITRFKCDSVLYII